MSVRQMYGIVELGNPLPAAGPMELNSHADTCCDSSNCVVLVYVSKSCNVICFNRDNTKDELVNIPIIKAATAYDAPTGETIIIVIPQALYLAEHISYSLLCPNQMRHCGMIVDDIPRNLAPNPNVATHSIYIPNQDIRIPLEMHGIISLFHMHRPSTDEIENCTWVQITSELDWDPHSSEFQEKETLESGLGGYILAVDRSIFSLSSNAGMMMRITPEENLLDISPAFAVESFFQIATTSSSNQSNTVTKEALSDLWGIGLNAAAQTLQVTTQKGIRNAVHPIVRRFATKLPPWQIFFRYVFSECKSSRNNTMAPLFVNDIKFMRIVPMKRKSEAANVLIELIQDIGIPASFHCDGAMELQYDKWKDIGQDYGIQQPMTELYSPWQNRAEINIHEAKKSIQRLIQHSNIPLPLWDYCATYVAKITSLTSNDIYVLHGCTQNEVVTGNTLDITDYVEF
jgi:hypothetical protein